MAHQLRYDHTSISVGDLDEAIAFYRDVIGMTEIRRPAFESPGAWFDAGGVPVHLTTGGFFRGPGQRLQPNDPHLALQFDGDLDAFLEDCRGRGIKVTELANSPAAYRQTFLHDPWGNTIELCINFSDEHPA